MREAWPETSWLEIRPLPTKLGDVNIIQITKDNGNSWAPFIPAESHLIARDWKKKDNGGVFGRKG